MKLLKSLVELIIESKVDDIYIKYYSNIPRAVFDKIVKADPKTKVQNDNIILMGKYAKVLLNIYKIGNMPNLENLVEATRYLRIIYDKNLAIDIKQIKEISDLHPIVKDYLVTGDTPIKTIIKALSKDSYKLLHNGEKWVVFTPKTEKAAAWLGVGSSWCTTWGKYTLTPSYKGRTNMFAQYSYAPIYIMIDKSDEKNKFQFQFAKEEFRNVIDGMIDIIKFFDNHKELRDFYFPLLTSENENSVISKDDQYNRINTLSKSFAAIIQNYRMKDLIEMGVENKVALAFAENKNFDELKDEDIISDGNVDEISYVGSNIIFELKKQCSNSETVINDAYSHINYLQGEISSPDLYERMKDNVYHSREILTNSIDSYFQENQSYVPFIKYNFPTLEKFVSNFKDNVYNKRQYYQKIKETYLDKAVELSEPTYIGLAERALNKVKTHYDISESGYYTKTQTLSANAVEFIEYLNRIDKPQITNFCKVFSDYIDDTGVNYEDYFFDYDEIYPEDKEMFTVIEEILDDFISENFQEYDDDQHSDLAANRTKLIDLISKYYTENNGYKAWQFPFKFENSSVEIYLSASIDILENEIVVPVYVLDLKTKGHYVGNIQVDDLYSNMFNYKLEYIDNNKNLTKLD